MFTDSKNCAFNDQVSQSNCHSNYPNHLDNVHPRNQKQQSTDEDQLTNQSDKAIRVITANNSKPNGLSNRDRRPNFRPKKNDNNQQLHNYHWPEVTFCDQSEAINNSNNHIYPNSLLTNYLHHEEFSSVSGENFRHSDDELLLTSTIIPIEGIDEQKLQQSHSHNHVYLQSNGQCGWDEFNRQHQQQQQHRKRLITNDSGDSIESSTNSSEKKKPVIPDGGYGWVVVFASLVVSLIADGLSFSFGLINTELLAYFGESPSKTAWISSLFFSVPLLMGPIWSNLVDKYGCRKMTMIGGVVSGIGFGLSSFCNSIEMLMVTFGIISGLGLGIGYVTAVVSIAFWFDKKRTFATGIGASGTGIGTFLYAPLTQWLIDSYGWRGATLILASTMLNTCVCGALMRDPDWLIEENRLESRSQSVTTFSNSSVCLEEIKKLLDTGATKEYVLDTLVTKNNTEANQQLDNPHESVMKRYRSEIFLPTYLIASQEFIEDMYEVKSLSRRSLRQRDGVEAPSKENLLSLSLSLSSAAGGPATALTNESERNKEATITNALNQEIATKTPERKFKSRQLSLIGGWKRRNILASAETLSPSEKDSQWSINSHCVRKSSPTSSLHRNLNQSRRSLNENLIFLHCKDLALESKDHSWRGHKTGREKERNKRLRCNSVDILNHNLHLHKSRSQYYSNPYQKIDSVNNKMNLVTKTNTVVRDKDETVALMSDIRDFSIVEEGKIGKERKVDLKNVGGYEEEDDMMTIIDMEQDGGEEINDAVIDKEINDKCGQTEVVTPGGGGLVKQLPNDDCSNGLRRSSRTKKLYYRSNLRRNISIRNSNFLKDMRIHRNSIHYRGAMLNTHRYRLRASSCPNIYRNSMTTIAKDDNDHWYSNLLETMQSIFDVSLFKDAKFTLFNLSTLSLFIWFIIPYLYLPEYMKTYSYETAVSAQLISAIGVAQTIGMIGLGYLGDRSWMNVNVCYSGCMIICGLSVGLMPLMVKHYYGILIMCIVFGFTFASSFSFTPSILVSIVDLDDFTCAYGLVLLVQGIGMIAGPPIAGMIYELTLSWDYAFYFAGIFIVLSGILSYLIEFCEKRKEPDNEREGSETRRSQIPLH